MSVGCRILRIVEFDLKLLDCAKKAYYMNIGVPDY